MFDRVLIANRGEIAVRVARTCRRLGIPTVAVASEPDRDAPHVRAADEVVVIGPAPANRSYLDVDRIVQAARDTGAQAIHPGYGFLSESPAFAEAVAAADLTFVGPSAEVMRLMGDKAAAKRHLAAAGVPLIPGTSEDALDDEALLAAAQEVGAPLLVKAVAGGGGKGMRTVRDLAELPAALAAARREASASFGDDRLMLERLVTEPRHIEVQVLADRHGAVLHLLERECSIQRRHQKVVEECPSPVVDARLREPLGEAAVTAARSVDYEGAGTIEFLLDAATLSDSEPSFAFLEMNTRLQVEHPVTELVTGLDLVEQQLRVAAGEHLGFGQDDVRMDGHAIEVRLYAEDPVTHLPQTGPVQGLRWPEGPGVRVDAGIDVGSEVTAYYDPMLAKLCVHAPDRDQACTALVEALQDTYVFGVTTNLELLRAIAEVPAFRAGELTTAFLTDHLGEWSPPVIDEPVIDAAIAALAAPWSETSSQTDPMVALGPFRLGQVGGTPVRVVDGDRSFLREVRVGTDGSLDIEPSSAERIDSHAPPPADGPEDRPPTVWVTPDRRHVWVHTGPATRAVEVHPATRHGDLTAAGGGAAFTAPMPGSVLEVGVEAGQRVAAGTTLVVVEAMKMEHPIVAPQDGTVAELHVRAGDRVEAGTALLSFTAEAAEGSA